MLGATFNVINYAEFCFLNQVWIQETNYRSFKRFRFSRLKLCWSPWLQNVIISCKLYRALQIGCSSFVCLGSRTQYVHLVDERSTLKFQPASECDLSRFAYLVFNLLPRRTMIFTCNASFLVFTSDR